MSTWTDDLENQVRAERKNSPRAVAAPANKDYTWVFLLGILILAVVAAFIFFQNKGYTPIAQQPSNNYYSQWDRQESYNYNNTQDRYNYNRLTTDQRVDRLESAARQIWERSKWNSDHMTLLATIHNHNMVVIRDARPRSELILLNSDWTINRLPDRIYLDYQDREFLKRYLKR
ncbi:MAG: hypothetical protein DWQ19_09350 [Crenarchaeota archaeon]|nr:MAG: hypothetical protein DWQ19_09350 [Thermoproteota archaeon]